MAQNAAITIRIPDALKQRLMARARREHRSLSAQVLADLEAMLDQQPLGGGTGGKFLGMFRGKRVPSEADVEEVRAQLWGNLGERALDRG